MFTCGDEEVWLEAAGCQGEQDRGGEQAEAGGEGGAVDKRDVVQHARATRMGEG